jgi:hypothetical protein
MDQQNILDDAGIDCTELIVHKAGLRKLIAERCGLSVQFVSDDFVDGAIFARGFVWGLAQRCSFNFCGSLLCRDLKGKQPSKPVPCNNPSEIIREQIYRVRRPEEFSRDFNRGVDAELVMARANIEEVLMRMSGRPLTHVAGVLVRRVKELST